MSSKTATVASFIESAPPGELTDVLNDIKALTGDDSVTKEQQSALKKYCEEQFTVVRLPGSSEDVVITPYNELEPGKYYDPESNTSFAFDHATQKASASQSYTHDSSNSSLITSISKAFRTYGSEHYPAAAIGVYPSQGDQGVEIVLVANKYSPGNFWNGRWRSHYTLKNSSSSLKGTIAVDVHYYEDGNVRLLTNKSLSLSSSSSSASDIVKQIASAERAYQEELNRGFASLSEGAFKGLRRQLPITRQRVEWEKVAGYKIGREVGGVR